MSIEVTRVEAGGIEVVAISGHIVGSSESSREFHELFRALIEGGKRKFVINLADTPWTNSLGVGMLMGAYTSVKSHGGDVVLANATVRIRDLLRVTRLDAVFELFDSLEAAVERLGRSDDPPTAP